MARVVAAAWFPRSHIHLFETFSGLNKVELEIDDISYRDDLSFTIKNYRDYPVITLTQDWSGLHYFTVELPDEDIAKSADRFMKDMQMLLVEKVLKACHSVSYKQIVSDIIPLDFHVVVLKAAGEAPEGYVVKEAGDLKVAYKPEEYYYSGTTSYVLGSDDASHIGVLLYHAYTEIASDLLYNMMKGLVRLYHEADTVVMDLDAASNPKDMKKPMKVLNDVVKESSERHGKLQQVIANIQLKLDEYGEMELSDADRELAAALEIPESFRRLGRDGAYMDILWGDVLVDRLQDISSTLDARVIMHAGEKKKGWF